MSSTELQHRTITLTEQRDAPMTTPCYTVETTLLRAEKLRNSTRGNPQFKLHTEAGRYLTATNINQTYELTPRSRGEITLEIVDHRVTGWQWR